MYKAVICLQNIVCVYIYMYIDICSVRLWSAVTQRWVKTRQLLQQLYSCCTTSSTFSFSAENHARVSLSTLTVGARSHRRTVAVLRGGVVRRGVFKLWKDTSVILPVGIRKYLWCFFFCETCRLYLYIYKCIKSGCVCVKMCRLCVSPLPL